MIKHIIEKLDNHSQKLVGHTFDTSNLQQRGTADLIEKLCCDIITECKSDNMLVIPAKSRRSLEDIQVELDHITLKIDIKSRHMNSDFSMPNLVSTDVLERYYSKSDSNYLCYVFVDYTTDQNTTTIHSVNWKRIEEISWSNLGIENLGKGQIQLKNITNIKFIEANREAWMAQLCHQVDLYYIKLINKIETQWMPKWKNNRWTKNTENEWW